MDITIEQIGETNGIILSKDLLQKYNFKDKVEIILEKGYIVIKSISEPRSGWEKAFKNMHKNGDDKLLMTDIMEDETFDEPKFEVWSA